MGDWIIDYFIGPFLFTIVVVGIGLTVFCGVMTSKEATTPHETITLRKDEWDCTESTTRLITSMMTVGKTLVPITNSQRVCTQWSER